MRLVIDSNEYIFAFGPVRADASLKLLEQLLETRHSHIVRIPRTIFEEVKRNLLPDSLRDFIIFINEFPIIDEDFLVPFEIAFKYERQGLKTADAFIAAYIVTICFIRIFLTRDTKMAYFYIRNTNKSKVFLHL